MAVKPTGQQSTGDRYETPAPDAQRTYPTGSGSSEKLEHTYRPFVSSGNGSKEIAKFLELARDILKNDSLRPEETESIQLIPIMGSQIQFIMDMVVVLYTSETESGKVVSGHTLMFANKRNFPPREAQVHMGTHTEKMPYTVVPGDTYTVETRRLISDYVKKQTGASQFVDAGHSVIPRIWAQDIDEDKVRRVLNPFCQAAEGSFVVSQGKAYLPFSREYLGNQDYLTAHIDWVPPVLLDMFELAPIHQDVSIELACTTKQERQHEFSSGVYARELCKIHGYLDLTYAPPQPQPVSGFTGQAYNQPPQHNFTYVPTLTVSAISSDLATNSLPLHLLALSTLGIINGNWRWAQGFRPRYGDDSKIDTRDIGAIGYENQTLDKDTGEMVQEKIDTKSTSFDDTQLLKLVSTYCKPNLLIRMDIPEEGPQRWVHSAFIEAANFSSPHQAAARDAILNACNDLTNGAMQRHWTDISQPICVDNGDRIHLGVQRLTTGRDGEWDDIRKVSTYLGVLNLMGGEDIQMVDKWDRTFSDKQQYAAQGVAQREAMLDSMLGQNKLIMAYATRIYFNMNFLWALAMACQEAKIAPVASNLTEAFGPVSTRRSYQDVSALLSDAQMPSMYMTPQNPAFNTNQSNPFGNTFSGNWGTR